MKRDKRLGIGIAIGIAILVLSIAASQTVSAQLNGAIAKGYVSDTESNPIEGVLVEWRNSETIELLESTTTTLAGYYSTPPHLFDYTGGVNINEIMYKPTKEQGYAKGEWLELYNHDVVAVNINGWTIKETMEVGTITEDIIMQPGSYVVLARNKGVFEAYYGELSCPITEVPMKLKNNVDTIILRDNTELEVDSVTYTKEWGAYGNGKTLELNARGGWQVSLGVGGTPCKKNSDIDITMCGDVNCNGKVDMGDVTLLLNHVSYGYSICDEWAGDVNCNGEIDMGDVTLLLNHVSYRYPLNCC